MDEKITYFISYFMRSKDNRSAFGNCILATEKITKDKDLKEIQEFMKNKASRPEENIEIVEFVILNFKELA